MFVFGNFLRGIATVLDMALTLYLYIVIVRAVLSWVNPDPFNPIVRFLRQATDPVFYRVRQRIPTVFGGMDFTPIIIILAIYFLQTFVVRSLIELSMRLN